MPPQLILRQQRQAADRTAAHLAAAEVEQLQVRAVER